MTYPMYIASIAWILLLVGYIKRRQRGIHVFCMRCGIGMDIALVLFLQVTRNAIQTAVALDSSIYEQIHILCSTLALFLYFPVLYFGWLLLQGKASALTRIWHIRIGVTALALRTLGFLFMFSML